MKKNTINNLLTYALLFVIIFLPKINIITVPGSITGIRIEDFLIILYFINYIFIKDKEKSLILKKIRNKFTLYIFFCILSLFLGIILFNNNILIGILFILRKIEYFIYIYVGYRYYKLNKNADIIHKIISISILYHLVILILQSKGIIGSYRLGSIQEDISEDRLCSFFNGAYEFSAYLLLFLIYFLNKVKYNKFNFIYIILITIEIYLSQSRTSLVIMVLLILLYYIFNNKKIARIIIRILIVVPILSIIIFSIPSITEKLPRFDTLNIDNMIVTTKIAWENKNIYSFIETGKYSLVSGINVDYSYNIRINKVMTLIDGFIKYPILGCGIGIIKGPADCNYARILAESGLIGMVLFLNVYIYIYRFSKEDENDYSIIIRYGLISIFIGSIFIDLFEASKIMMILWFIIGIEIFNKEKNKIKSKESQYES